MTEEFDMFDCLDSDEDKIREYDIVRAPLAWPGGKTRIADKIVECLPIGKGYIEPFGGSAAVMFARPPVKLEVYNDRFGGVVAFYRCLRHEAKYKKLVELLELTVHSREEYRWCKENWQNRDHFSDVERAAMWYYTMTYSFAGLGRHWGRAVRNSGRLAGKIRNNIENFAKIHARLRNVQVENQDWRVMLEDYDHPDHVIYCDPPYLEVNQSIYSAGELSPNDHAELLDRVHSCKSFVAVSSYKNDLYDSYGWDDVHMFDKMVTMTTLAHSKGSTTENVAHLQERGKVTEVLYIKEAD